MTIRTLEEMKEYLERHSIEDGSVYTHGGLGGGDIDGTECIDGAWNTYFSERGSKNSYPPGKTRPQRWRIFCPGL